MVAAAMITGCATAASPDQTSVATPVVTPATAVAPGTPVIADAPTGDDWARVGEAVHLLETGAPDVWVGWGDEVPVMLLEAGNSDWLTPSAAGVDGLDVVRGLDVEGRQVYRRAGRLVPGIGVQELPSGFAIAMLSKPEMQALIDRTLGAGAVNLDDVQYVRWITHETFHAFEIRAMSGDLPRFGYGGDEMDMIGRLTATPGHLDGIVREGELLLAALDAEGEAATIDAVRRFLEARTARRLSGGQDVEGFERAVEWAEGLARYADTRLLQAAGSGYTPTPEFAGIGARYPSPEAAWSDAVQWLADLRTVPGTLRDWYYELGAAQAYLLDRLMPGWHTRALPGGESLEALLSEAVARAETGVPAGLRAFPIASVRLGGQAMHVAVADTPDGWTRGLEGVRNLGPVDGLLFAFPEPVDAEFFMRGALIPLDIAFIDPESRVAAVAAMPLCAVDPCPTYRSPIPYRWALETPAGGLANTIAGDRLTFDR